MHVSPVGARLSFGSDWPAMTLDPRVWLREAITSSESDADGPLAPAEPVPGLTLAAAIDAYTSGAAYASFDEKRKGTLAPGMLADIVVLSADIFATPAERLLDVLVEMTIFDGEVVYSRAGANTD